MLHPTTIINYRRTFFALCVMGLVCFSHASVAAAERSVEKVMTEALAARKAGNLERTLELLQEAYSIKPAPELLNNLGRVYEMLGRYGEALEAYQKVVDDPEADPTLRAMDAARAAPLRDKVGKAWLKPKITPKGANVLVDGATTGTAPGAEFGVAYGKHHFEVSHAEVTTLTYFKKSYDLDKRTHLVMDLKKKSKKQAVLYMDPLITELSLDGYKLQSDLASIKRIHLPRKKWTLSMTRKDGRTHSQEVTLKSGKAADLKKMLPPDEPAPAVAQPAPQPAPAAPAAQPAPASAPAQPAAAAAAAPTATEPAPAALPATQPASSSKDSTTAPPTPEADAVAQNQSTISAQAAPPETEGGSGPWSYVTGGLGLAIAGTGAALYFIGIGQISDLQSSLEANKTGSAISDTVGSSTPILPSDMTRQATQTELDDASQKQLIGLIMVGLGAAVTVGGLMWILGDATSGGEDEAKDDAPVTVTRFSVGPQGFVLSGSF